MKKQLLKSALIALAGVGLLSGSGWAIPTLEITATGALNTITVADGSALDLSNVSGAVVSIDTIGDYVVEISSGFTKPIFGTADFPILHLGVQGNTTNANGILTVKFSENNFNVNDPTYLQSFLSSVGGVASQFTWQAYYSNTNNLFSLDTAIGTFLTTDSYASTSWSGSIIGDKYGYYSLTVVGTLKGTGSFDGQLSAVPEPATMLLFGTGIIGLAGAARRKNKIS